MRRRPTRFTLFVLLGLITLTVDPSLALTAQQTELQVIKESQRPSVRLDRHRDGYRIYRSNSHLHDPESWTSRIPADGRVIPVHWFLPDYTPVEGRIRRRGKRPLEVKTRDGWKELKR